MTAPADLDLPAVRRRAQILREVSRPREERSDAALQASDDLLALADEIERLRTVLSGDAAELVERLRATRLLPIREDGPLAGLHAAIAGHIARFVDHHAPKDHSPPSWDLAIGPLAVEIMACVDAHLRTQIERRTAR